ncbi:hypothetical protein ACFR97_07090 [Haloplanus litoreus]|uniref:AtuA-like ferredoxin-fold domain-containing protein n=1 Tax=Haloplanus litoreus TaxID=767515 RepID=A0ABD5ZZ87_9EURY
MSVDIANVDSGDPFPDAGYRRLEAQLTADRVTAFFGAPVAGDVRRYPMPNVRASNCVCERSLDGGGQTTLRSDTQGKTYAVALPTTTLPPLTGMDHP